MSLTFKRIPTRQQLESMNPTHRFRMWLLDIIAIVNSLFSKEHDEHECQAYDEEVNPKGRAPGLVIGYYGAEEGA